jgi:hypothetical protein
MKKILIIGVGFLFIFSALIPITVGIYVRTYIENNPTSTMCQINVKPPLPPLAWTEDFSTIFLKIPGDPGGDTVYYTIDWGDGSVEEWIGPYPSGETVSFVHLWSNGFYILKFKVRTSNGNSEWATYCLSSSSDFKFFYPSTGYIGIDYKFSIYLEDFGRFIFDWGDGTKSDWNNGIAIPHVWSAQGEYGIIWKAEDPNGLITQGDPIIIEILQIENYQPPDKTIINGPTSGKPGEELCWTFQSTDPDGDDIKYLINWGDGSSEETDCYPSGTPVTVCHTYSETGEYRLGVQAQECPDGLLGPEATLSLTIPRNRVKMSSCLFRFIEMFPIFQRLLDLL